MIYLFQRTRESLNNDFLILRMFAQFNFNTPMFMKKKIYQLAVFDTFQELNLYLILVRQTMVEL